MDDGNRAYDDFVMFNDCLDMIDFLRDAAKENVRSPVVRQKILKDIGKLVKEIESGLALKSVESKAQKIIVRIEKGMQK
ncbi:MAG: hypothetical protein FWG39_02825 [Alphaproteobacteria bacterium]|nr:hypothetical protein [Alphaproteobacteria bacterium]